MTIGKKASETTMMIREVFPSPKRSMMIGARAIFGITCDATRIG